ncbi:S26 family signal peptidase [Streptomyces spinoverrucosus]|uniref:S26 family signal peptidase n=1 Tax=Streptomyces spinoverrucosus TaxID=284043 RepID=UPI0018C3D71D|nr:S26 family signal peptidase [Streptomyces spinoverrucosus]MBG0857418.1 S26 family signal peptidase [Streptomyces spinoverrucosus]
MTPVAASLLIGLGLAGVAVVALIRRTCVVVTVEGTSMIPTFHPGDRVLVRRVGPAGVSAGRLVVTEPPAEGRWDTRRRSGWLIKRVAAVPGDPVPREGAPALRSRPEERVPDGRLVLLGDNPAESLDSRFHGYFRADRIVGVVIRQLPHAARLTGPAPSTGKDFPIVMSSRSRDGR